MQNRIQRLKNVPEEEQEALLKIFKDATDDPEWFEKSAHFDVFSQRIPIIDFIHLLTLDSKWQKIASKAQTSKVMDLFDKVYGYSKGRSRLQEQNYRFQKRLQNATPSQETDHGGVQKQSGKGVINELFEVAKYLNSVDLVDRYSNYLNNILIKSRDQFI